jgi:PAS domain S-box-containing protein
MSPAERTLAESYERYRSLFDYNPHAAFSLDLAGQFTDANVVAQKLSGYSLDELQAMAFTDIICTEDLPLTIEAFEDVLNRLPQQLEARMWHQDGHVIEMNLTAMPVVVDGEVVGVHGVAEDVTERNEMRRELERTHKLAEEASATKTLFLANMSHEVRTPLTSMIGATELLMDEDLDASHARFVEMIHRSGEKLLRLVNDILDFSRLEAGRVELHDAAVSVRTLVGDAVAWFTPMARQAHLDFTCTVDPALPENLAGDGMRITQVLTNLLENALKFTHQGHVRLAIELAGLDGATAEVRFRVEDSGIGIPAEQLPTLFQSFTQADTSITRSHGGAGLGLAICEELVTLMGGFIRAESALGAGSSFAFTLPLRVLPAQ